MYGAKDRGLILEVYISVSNARDPRTFVWVDLLTWTRDFFYFFYRVYSIIIYYISGTDTVPDK